MVKVIEFKGKTLADDGSDPEKDERAMILATLENVMIFQERLESGMKLMTLAFSQMQAHIRDLEHEVAELQKKKKPAILNAVGQRAN